MNAIPTSIGNLTPGQVLGELTYISYASNRDRSPEITPEQWAKIFGDVANLEARYQTEVAIRNARHA